MYVCMYVCMFPHIFDSFACLRLNVCRRAWEPTGMFLALTKFKIIPVVGVIMKEHIWTFDVDYISQNNRSS